MTLGVAATILFVTAAFLPFTLPLVAAGLLVRVVVVGRRRGPAGIARDHVTWFGASLYAAALLYCYACYRGGLLYLADIEDVCPDRPGFRSSTETFLPPGRTCSYADGTTEQLVPAGVHIAIVLLGVAAVVFLVRAVRRGRRRDARTAGQAFASR